VEADKELPVPGKQGCSEKKVRDLGPNA
jgi:hypothetical protein